MFRISYILLAIIILSSACSTAKKTVSLEQDFEAAYRMQNYDQALIKADRLFALKTQNGETPDSIQKIMAGKAAFHTQKYNRTIEFLSDIVTDDSEALEMLGLSYQYTGNTEREISHWEKYLNYFKETDLYPNLLTRLFNYNFELGDYKKALHYFNAMPEPKSEEIMGRRLILFDKIGEPEKMIGYAEQILKTYPGNEQALFIKAKNIYEKAEKWYQDEMAKYNRNANYTTYAYLRRELRHISAEFRNARDLFVELHKAHPDKIVYASYLRNIYVRLEMRDEAASMDRLIKKSQQ